MVRRACRLSVLSVLVACVGLCEPAGVALGITSATVPAMDGSTSALPLAKYVLAEMLGLECCRVVQGWGAETSVMARVPEEGTGALDLEAARKFGQLWHSGTHGAYVNLVGSPQGPLPGRSAGQTPTPPRPTRPTDLILVARGPSGDELELAERAGVELDAVPVARDAFVFLVHKDNPVNTLTVDRARAIYSGNVPNWSYLGWDAVKINAYQRDRNSGSQELMEDLVMGDTPMAKAPDMVEFGMAGPFNRINSDRHGLGYTVYYYQKFVAAQDRNVKVCPLNGVVPTAQTIASKEYPLTCDVYAAIRKDLAADSPARRLRDWLLTPAGQAVVARSGYVPISAN